MRDSGSTVRHRRWRSGKAAVWLALAWAIGPQHYVLAQGSASEDPEIRPVLPEIKLDVRPREVTVGEPVQAELSLIFAADAEEVDARMPAWQETWGSAEIVQIGEPDSSRDNSGRRILRQSLLLTAFETGSIDLPPISLSLPFAAATLEAKTPEGIGFEVISVLPEGEEKIEPMGAAAPILRRTGPRFLGSTALLGLLNLGAVLLLLRRLTHSPGHAGYASLDPMQELLRRLSQVDPESGAEPVHTGLSLALRRYLGRTLGFPGTESTTSEVQRRLRDTPLPMTLTQQAMRLLRVFDQVKFARSEVAVATSGERLAGTESLAREIESSLHPPEADEGEDSPKASS